MKRTGNNKILLVEPVFPIPTKSKNHSNFLPIGLLKLASYFRSQKFKVQLVRGNEEALFYPRNIYITSLFTYWSSYVKESVTFYRNLYPKSIIIVGGIYATLMPKHCKEYTRCDEVFVGQHKEAEKFLPAYDLVDVDYQIIQGMRGCSRKCPFCGIWKIEKLSFKNAKQIQNEICSNNLIFYDNNMFVNPDIENILIMLSETTYNGRILKCECQSGFDGRILAKKPALAKLLKIARFENIRLAWDFAYEQYSEVEDWILILEDAGYKRKDIFVFMVYNWSFDFEELEEKRKKCFEWGVQIADCRFRPLNQTFDNYNSHVKLQTSEDYYIHSNWSDYLIRKFRSNVRKHNICIRYKIDWDNYDIRLERLNSKKSRLSKSNSLIY
jgi:hypothetical protein